MKLKSLTIFVILINILPSISQIDNTSLYFYPLKTNNYWQYHQHSWELWTPFSWNWYYSIEVNGDTILSNGKEYKILERISFDSLQTKSLFFERIDTLTCNVYRYYPWLPGEEVLIDSLVSQEGDTSNAFRGMFDFHGYGSFCDSIYNDTILGSQTLTKRIQLIQPLDHQYHLLSQGFGLIYQYADYDFGVTTINLIYAVINGKESGNSMSLPSIKESSFSLTIKLYPNYPNPINPSTNIEFDLPKTSEVTLKIFNTLGEEVVTLVSDRLNSGSYSYDWNASNMASGVYLYRLEAGKYIETRKMVLIR